MATEIEGRCTRGCVDNDEGLKGGGLGLFRDPLGQERLSASGQEWMQVKQPASNGNHTGDDEGRNLKKRKTRENA